MTTRNTNITSDLTLQTYTESSTKYIPKITLPSDNPNGYVTLQGLPSYGLSVSQNLQINSTSPQNTGGMGTGPMLSEGSNHELKVSEPIIVKDGITLENESASSSISLNTSVQNERIVEFQNDILVPKIRYNVAGGGFINMFCEEGEYMKITPSSGAGISEPLFRVSGDASFVVNNATVKISDLYDPENNIKNIANVVSSLCRRVYTLSHTEGEGKEIEDNPSAASGGKKGGDDRWIKYFAGINTDSANPPGVPDT